MKENMHSWRNGIRAALRMQILRVQISPSVRCPCGATGRRASFREKMLEVQILSWALSGMKCKGVHASLGTMRRSSSLTYPTRRCCNRKTWRFQKLLYEGSNPFRRSKRKENSYERTNTDTKPCIVRGGSSGVREQQPYKLCVEGSIPSRPIKCLDSSVGRAGGC